MPTLVKILSWKVYANRYLNFCRSSNHLFIFFRLLWEWQFNFWGYLCFSALELSWKQEVDFLIAAYVVARESRNPFPFYEAISTWRCIGTYFFPCMLADAWSGFPFDGGIMSFKLGACDLTSIWSQKLLKFLSSYFYARR